MTGRMFDSAARASQAALLGPRRPRPHKVRCEQRLLFYKVVVLPRLPYSGTATSWLGSLFYETYVRLRCSDPGGQNGVRPAGTKGAGFVSIAVL